MHLRAQGIRKSAHRKLANEAGTSQAAERNSDGCDELVREALANLSDPTRETATLYYINGYSVAEVSRFLGKPAGTVRRRLHSARTRLRKELLTMMETHLKRSRPGKQFTETAVRKITEARLVQRGRKSVLLLADADGKTYWSSVGIAEAPAIRRRLSDSQPPGIPDLHTAVPELLREMGYKIVSIAFRGDVATNWLATLRVKGHGRTRVVEAGFCRREGMQFAVLSGAKILLDEDLAARRVMRGNDGKPMSMAAVQRAWSRQSAKPPFRNIGEVFSALEKDPDSLTARRVAGEAGPTSRYGHPLTADGGRGVEDLKAWMIRKKGTPMEGIAAGLVGVLYLDHHSHLSNAMRYLKKAHRLRPKDRRIAFDLATVYAQKSMSDEAFGLLLDFGFDDAGMYRNFEKLRKDPRFKRISANADASDQNLFRIEQTGVKVTFGEVLPWEGKNDEETFDWPTVTVAKISKTARARVCALTKTDRLVAVRSASLQRARRFGGGSWALLELEDGRPVAIALPGGPGMRRIDVLGALYPDVRGSVDRPDSAAQILNGLNIRVEAVVLKEVEGSPILGAVVASHGRRRRTITIDGLAAFSLAVAMKSPVLLTPEVAEQQCLRGKNGRPLSLIGAKRRLRAGGQMQGKR